jgi:hypothetical protein
VDVQRAYRRRTRVAQPGSDALVARVVGDHRVALDGGPVRAGGDQTHARGKDGAAQLAQLDNGLVDRRADAGDELDLAAVKLALDLAARRLADLR